MTPRHDALDESASIIEEIETNLERVLQKRRDAIEQELQDKIRREKEESERKLSEISQEFEKERESLKDYRETISVFETRKDTLLAEVRACLDRAMGHQNEIEKLTGLTLEELRKVDELSGGLIELRQRSEEKILDIKAKLKDKYGLPAESSAPAAKAAPAAARAGTPSSDSTATTLDPAVAAAAAKAAPAVPPTPARDDNGLGADLEHELTKLKKIKELLEKDSLGEAGDYAPAVPSAPAAPFYDRAGHESPAVLEEHAPAPPVIPGPDAPGPEFKMPEINQFIQDFVRRESEAPAPKPFPEPVQARREDKKIAGDEINFQFAFERLEKYRKSEPTDYNGEISYFQNKDRVILDGESLIRAVSYIQETARKLTQKLAQTESPKDQFFLKQELINNQEILRKVILRAVRMCEKDNAALPRFSSEVLNVGVLKDIVEKLNMDNWSNADDFRSFEEFAGGLKDRFYKRITPPAHYLQSIVEELEG